MAEQPIKHRTKHLEDLPGGEEVIRRVREKTDSVLVAFSGGKDSACLMLTLKDRFPRLIPFYMYLIPDLAFIEKGLRYYEEFFETPILRVPHPGLYRFLKYKIFQPPGACEVIDATRMPLPDISRPAQLIMDDLGLPRYSTWVARGLRAFDNPIRRRYFTEFGPLHEDTRTFEPIWSLNKAQVLSVLDRSGIVLPVDYQMFGRSFDGIGWPFLKEIRSRFPTDYVKIKAFFPLIDLEFKRHNFAHHGNEVVEVDERGDVTRVESEVARGRKWYESSRPVGRSSAR